MNTIVEEWSHAISSTYLLPFTSWQAAVTARSILALPTGFRIAFTNIAKVLIPGFTKKYGVTRLVWYEPHESMTAAIQREKSIKKYKREWKINLIERDNPNWDDLFPALVGMKRNIVKG